MHFPDTNTEKARRATSKHQELSASPKAMPDKSYVGLQLEVSGWGEAIPWEYVSATRLRMVLENDDRVGAMDPPDFFYCCVVRLFPGYQIFIFTFK